MQILRYLETAVNYADISVQNGMHYELYTLCTL